MGAPTPDSRTIVGGDRAQTARRLTAACAALQAAYAHLASQGCTQGQPVPAWDMAALHDLVGFQDVWDFERRHVETP